MISLKQRYFQSINWRGSKMCSEGKLPSACIECDCSCGFYAGAESCTDVKTYIFVKKSLICVTVYGKKWKKLNGKKCL